MTFISLDDKQECIGVYTKGELKMQSDIPAGLSRTWQYLPFLHDKQIEYAQLYCGGKSIDEVCSEEFKPEWERVSKKLRAYITSFFEAKINLNEVCFYDLVPVQFLKEFFDAKCKIVDGVFEKYEKPHDYEHRLGLEMLLADIRSRVIEVDRSPLKKRYAEMRVRSFLKKLDTLKLNVDYNQFGSRTGRLTSAPNTFPILTMDKSYRSIIKPKNGWFVELDYNAAELRTLLALSGKAQPDIDIHEWNMEQTGAASRQKAKEDVFAWLYGSSQVDGAKFDTLYDTDSVREKYWNGYEVINYFKRTIEADRHHSLNYIIQSTTSDLVLRQAVIVHKYIEKMISHISFIIHDSIIIDLDISEKQHIEKIAKLFSETQLGVFKTSVKVGKNLNNMREVHV